MMMPSCFDYRLKIREYIFVLALVTSSGPLQFIAPHKDDSLLDPAGMPLLRKASTEASRGRETAPFPCNPIPQTCPTDSTRAQL